jgi:hypothetical protein
VGGDIVTLIDVLHEGPSPAGLSAPRWRERRARFIADRGWSELDTVLARLAAIDAELERVSDHEEVVLWFEHDLNCQLALIRLLDWLTRRDLRATVLSLVCIGDFPGIPDFNGLGQLGPDQVTALFRTRELIGEEALTLGAIAWCAFCAADPRAIEAVLASDTSALPYLAAALVRHLEQFPCRVAGVSRTERQILEAVADGVHDPRELFRSAAARERPPFMGDTVFWSHLDALARGAHPLLVPEGACHVDRGRVADVPVALTEVGHDVLAGRRDHVLLNGIDRWLGGVHLHGADAQWRWDAVTRRLAQRSRA